MIDGIRDFVPGIFEHIESTVIFILTLGFVSFILRSKRPPGSTLAWLFFVFVIPYLGIPLYVFLGGRKFKTRFEKKALLYIPTGRTRRSPIQVGNLEKTLLALGTPPARENTKADLITSGEEAFQKTIALIGSAKKTIHLTTFIFSNDSVGRSILSQLEAKAREGVAVRILLDSLGATWVRHPSFRALKTAGGKIGHFMPLIHLPFQGRSNLRNHRKMLIIDSREAIVGGMNIANEYLGPSPDPKRWIDLCLLMEGPSVRDLEDIFICDWKFATEETFPLANSEACTSLKEKVLQVVASGPDVAGDSLYDALLILIYNARERVWIATPYFIPDESLAKALELAAKRNIDVRILVPRRSNHFLADLGRGTYLRQLANAGAQTIFTSQMMHAKAVLIDEDYGLLGSANLDMRSLLLNYELGVFLKSGTGVRYLESWFSGQFLGGESKLPKAGFFRDLAEGMGRVLGPLI